MSAEISSVNKIKHTFLKTTEDGLPRGMSGVELSMLCLPNEDKKYVFVPVCTILHPEI